MKNEWNFIAIDLGAESGRCFVALVTPDRIALNEIHRFPTHTLKINDSIHWNTDAIFSDILIGLAKAKDQFGSEFDGIGIDTWGIDYVLVNADGTDAGYPFQYRDDRTDGLMAEAFQIIPEDELYTLTGTKSAQYNTLFQLLAEKKNKTGLLHKAAHFLLMPEYFNFRLTGVKKSEFTIASTTGITDPRLRNWSRKTIETFGIPENIFSEMVEPGTKLGTLLPSVAEITGISTGVPVFAVAGHDTACAAASIPASDRSWGFLSSGTWSLMGIELKNPIINSTAMKYGFTNEAGYNRTTTLLKNIVGLWPLQECRREWIKTGEEISYAQLTSLASANGFTGAWIDLTDIRFLKHGFMLKKVCDYLTETDQQLNYEPGFITGVILESLAYIYRKTIRQIEKLTGTVIEVIHITGGGIQNELLTQYTAEATGKTVIAGPLEGAVFGNIGIQAIASGAFKDITELRRVIRNSVPLKEYKPVNSEYFNINEKHYDRVINTKQEKH